MSGWPLRCPACGADLADTATPPGANETDRTRPCASCPAEYHYEAGIWRLLRPQDQAGVERFLTDYTHIRRAEGRGSTEAAYYRALPEPTPGDPLAWQWRIRARSWAHAQPRLFPAGGAPQRIIDVGAGVGWLANRLTLAGHDVVAVDLSLDDHDGLAAGRHYGPGFARVQAHFDHLPFTDGDADVVVFNASLHYSENYAVTMAEARRVLRPQGRVVVLDSPLYRHDHSGRQMVAERHADFEQRFGRRSDSVASQQYLTPAALEALAAQFDLRWERSRPFYGWRWAARPWVARWRRKREPARFELLVASGMASGTSQSAPRPGSNPRPEPGPRPEPASRPKLRRTWPQRLLLSLSVVAALASFATAGAVGVVYSKASNIQRLALEAVLAPASSPDAVIAPTGDTPPAGTPNPAADADALNILVVGVDNADGLDEGDRRRLGREGGLRSDTIMLVRVEPATGRVRLLSFPRDLWLPLGGDLGNDRINAALPLGGPELLIRTISENFELPVHHFLQVDFAQFETLVDVIGGVPFPFAYPVRDDFSGLYVGEAGCVLLDGPTALDYVRARYLQRLVGGEWESDPSADLSRIRRQQDFLRRALARVKDQGVSNPVRVNQLVNAAIGAITVDKHFSAELMLRLALRLRNVDPAGVPTYALPVADETTAAGAAVLLVRWAEAAPVLQLFRGQDPSDPATVSVALRGGSAALAEALTQRRFRVEAAGTNPTALAALAAPVVHALPLDLLGPAGPGTISVEASKIRHAPEDFYRAELLGQWLDGNLRLVATDAQTPGTVTLEPRGPLSVRSTARVAVGSWVDAATPSAGFLPSADETC